MAYRSASRMLRSLLIVFILSTVFTGFQACLVPAQNGVHDIHVMRIDGEITPAIASFLRNAINSANREGADGIIIEIQTLGGRVDSAIRMRDAIVGSMAPTVVYIESRAISAGALISIAADTIIMAPGSHMGSAEPVPNEPKAMAFVSGEFRTTANRTGRDPEIAAAMVDSSIVIEGLVGEGEILDLTADEAYAVGYADHIIKGRNEVLRVMGWENASVTEAAPDFRYAIAQFLTSYEIASILLTLGMLGIIAEFFTQGFGATGIIGLCCFALYFGGGIIAGSTELWAVFIFIAGIILAGIEILTPGFGIFGISGIAAISVSIIFSAPSLNQGAGTLFISLAATMVGIPVFFKLFGKSRFIARLVLSAAETPELGYTHADSKTNLLGMTGITQTVLRPSGSIIVDGVKVDAITDGEYISKGTAIRIIRVEGAKVIVRPDEG